MGQHFQATNLYQPPKSPLLDQVIYHGRSRTGAQLVPTNRKGVMALLKTLKQGGMVGILPDQEPDESGGEFVQCMADYNHLFIHLFRWHTKVFHAIELT